MTAYNEGSNCRPLHSGLSWSEIGAATTFVLQGWTIRRAILGVSLCAVVP